MRPLLAGLLAALAAGCTVGPDYVPPRPAVPAQFTEQPATPAQVAQATSRLKRWWAEFHDPLLDRLVDRAIAENYDLRIARQQLLAARESRLITAAGDDPVVNFGGSFSQDNSSTTLQYPPGIGAYRTYELGFDASYELDVFGGRRRAEEAADAQVAASIDDRRSILVSLLAELAADYTRLRGAQLRLSIAQRNVEAERQGLQLTQAAFDRGLGTDLEVAQARAQLETVQSDLPALQATIAVNAHAIGVLVGDAPGALEAELDRPAPLMPAPPVLPASVPSEVVAMRPDIGRAERRYAAANAQVGVAVAAEFPHFSIPLTLQPTSSYVSQLFRQASLVWMAGVVGTQRVYDGGRTTAEIRRARATAEQARLSYGGTVLVALREVEDALSGYRTETLRYATLRAAAADAALAQDRATKLYAAGLTDFLHVLEADRTAYLAQDRLARSQQAEVEQTIALFKALGGGWQGIDFGDPAEKG